jgi:hypothetical protein
MQSALRITRDDGLRLEALGARIGRRSANGTGCGYCRAWRSRASFADFAAAGG